MSPVSPSDSTEPQDLRCGHPPSTETPQPRPWFALPECLLEKKHGDDPNGKQPFALIHVQLFKDDVCQNGQTEDDKALDRRAYDRIVEGVDRVIRRNRNSHLYSLVDLGEYLLPLIFFAAGWAAGFGGALQLALDLFSPQ